LLIELKKFYTIVIVTHNLLHQGGGVPKSRVQRRDSGVKCFDGMA
jgi:hypothetical protein